MKRIAFTDFWDGFCPEEFIADMGIADICDVEVTDLEHADYVIYSLHGNKHWKSADRQIKIFYTVENLVPDFNACDYGIGFEWMDYGDRYLRMPLYYNYRDINELAEKKGKIARICLRINPDVGAHTHAKITTGLAENKFGIAMSDMEPAIERASQMPNIQFIDRKSTRLNSSHL